MKNKKMNNFGVSVLAILFLTLTTSCDNANTTDLSMSDKGQTKQYVEYKTEDQNYVLKTSKDDLTYRIEENKKLIQEGEYLKITDNLLVLKITEGNIVKNFYTTIDADGYFQSTIMDYSLLSEKDILYTYDIDYGFGNTSYIIDGQYSMNTYDYVNLYENEIYEQVEKKSIIDHEIVSLTYGHYNLKEDELYLEDKHYVLNNHFAWSIDDTSTTTYNLQLLKQCKTSYTLFETPQTITLNNIEEKNIKGYIWAFIKKDSIYNVDANKYIEDTIYIELSNGLTYYLTDFEINESTITLANSNIIIAL